MPTMRHILLQAPGLHLETCAIDWTLPMINRQASIIARSTNTQYHYEFWLCITEGSDDTFDAEFFWFTTNRNWLYVGSFSLLYILCQLGIGRRPGKIWTETWLYTNDYQDEAWSGGLTIHIRSSTDLCRYWVTRTMLPDAQSMWHNWRNLYLSWWTDNRQPMQPWTSFHQGSIPIPYYTPKAEWKKWAMLLCHESVPLWYRQMVALLWSI